MCSRIKFYYFGHFTRIVLSHADKNISQYIKVPARSDDTQRRSFSLLLDEELRPTCATRRKDIFIGDNSFSLTYFASCRFSSQPISVACLFTRTSDAEIKADLCCCHSQVKRRIIFHCHIRRFSSKMYPLELY